MTEVAEIRLQKKADEIVASIWMPGAIVEATGNSVKDALQMLADALDENDQPFWAVGEQEENTPEIEK